ncbi:MAG TPA: GNAT family N-acetyltransferase [Acidimicrobiales bacterium]|nr:GNAT family N-acetyltransferase [Acidimicrobiales bacterium]
MTGDAVHGPRTPPEVRLASTSERTAIAESLAAAFFDDPVMSWILADPGQRPRRLAGMFGVLLKGHYLPQETVWTTPGIDGAALWGPPGHAIVPTSAVLRNALSLLRALGVHSARALRALTHVEHLHPKEPHWYLGVLGTRPERQGTGIGSALLAPVLRRCDVEGLPAYLESSKESNLAFYGRHGFEVTGEIPLPGGGPTVWPMWRDPRPPET